MHRILICSLTVLCFVTAGGSALAQEAGSAFYDMGVYAFEEGDYQGAETHLTKALDADPENPRYNHYLGKTYIGMERFEDAKKFIETAWKGDPDLPELSYDRAFLYYKMSDYGKAGQLFKDVLKDDPSKVLAYFYGGISLYREKQYQEADQLLLTAAEKSPELMVKAFYFSGLCHFYLGQNQQAVERLTYVKSNTDSDEVRENADRWIERIQAGEKARKRYALQIKLAYEHDDNVPLEPTDQDDLYSEEADDLILGYASGEYNLIDQEGFVLGAGLSRFQTWHFDLDEYDVSETAGKLYTTYYTDTVSYGLKIMPSIYQIDGEDYLLTYQFSPEISYAVNSQLAVWLSYAYAVKDYRQSDYDDRDGNTHEGFLDMVYTLRGEKGYVLGGIGYEANTASEEEYDYGKFMLRAGGSFELAYAFRVGLMGTYAAKTYENEDPLEDKAREDTRNVISLSLSRKLFYDWLEIAAEYTYTQNDSNIEAYEYTRQVVGIGVFATF